MTTESVKHGTPSAYFNGCRCDLCRQAGVDLRTSGTYSDFMAGLTKTPPLFHPEDRSTPYDESDSRHGTIAGYTRGCRCTWCKEAGKAYRGYRKLGVPWPKDFNARAL